MASNLERSKDFFTKLSKDTLPLVDEFYDTNTLFQDPIHTLNGSAQVKKYYEGLYKNVDSIRFEFTTQMESGNLVSLGWRMHLQTPALNGGKEMTVDGVSIIRFNAQGKAEWHRDFFDMGEFVYERVPVLKWVIQSIKARLASQ